ncbi:MAG: MFS transporter [Herpetosiphonaceae bacterium]|nr:MFS transporter [Herpetosiphonaceae bacterium]
MSATLTKRWTLITMVLASGIVFLDGTVVNVALPTIDRNLHAGLSGLQWIVDGYLVTLAALLIVGGALGDRYGRRRLMVVGLSAFGVASVACGLAPATSWLVVARMLQGVAGALLVPGSLAIITAVYPAGEERGKAIGSWAGWAGITTLLGPLLGGWLVDTVSWRWVFFINVPLIVVTVGLLSRYVPETRDETASGQLDWLGALLVCLTLGGVTYGLIQGPVAGWSSPLVLGGLIGGVVALLLFVVVERRVRHPMVPLVLFRSVTFSGANLATLGIYTALSGMSFFVILFLQNVAGYSALRAGLALLPVTLIMMSLSGVAGKQAGKYGSRLFMTIGPLICAAGFLLLLRLQPTSGFWAVLLPAAIIIGLGLVVTVAPLTTAVMAAVPAHNAGIASAINNVVSRVAGLLAVAGLGAIVALTFTTALASRAGSVPAAARPALQQAAQDPTGAHDPTKMPAEAARVIAEAYTFAFHRAMLICAALSALGGIVSAFMIRNPAPAAKPDGQLADPSERLAPTA